ncbi:MAG: winged helix-turn-helix transcriptional regulator [Gammaproteobacteria bacterium]|nr:winged helix-turn-helix transcriptional regulator [Gammaproteobacteria bacterium]
MRSAADLAEPSSADAPLTPRQQEILRLLTAGAANKEIAERLGISLGTVKQHLASLYKRMNVRNRAMAVSKGMGQADSSPPQIGITRRPCAAMSLCLSPDCAEADARYLQRCLAGLAFDGKAIFLARDRQGGDLVFGVRHRAENLMAGLLQIGLLLQLELQAQPQILPQLSLSLTVGLALVTRQRFGGEVSDDLVASSVVAEARQLCAETPPGQLRLSQHAIGVLQAEGLGASCRGVAQMPLNELTCLFRPALADLPPLFGREAEWQQISRQLQQSQAQLLVLEGETGMGKSRLCQQLIQQMPADAQLFWLQALPIACAYPLLDLRRQCLLDRQALLQQLDQIDSAQAGLLIIDDFHLLPSEVRQAILPRFGATGRLHWLLAGRRIELETADLRLRLPRLDDAAIARLIQTIRGEPRADLTAESAGIPLFARELARHGDAELPLSLLMMITERLDGLRLDWKLLYLLSQGSKAMQIGNLAQAMGERPEQVQQAVHLAVKSGALSLHGQGEEAWVAFHHPLVRRVVEQLGMDWNAEPNG